MATSSITVNIAIHDEKEAKADYTTWHQRHFDNGESVSELGEKIKKFVAAKRQTAMA